MHIVGRLHQSLSMRIARSCAFWSISMMGPLLLCWSLKWWFLQYKKDGISFRACRLLLAFIFWFIILQSCDLRGFKVTIWGMHRALDWGPLFDSSLKWPRLQSIVATVVQAAMSLHFKHQDVCSVTDVVAVFFKLSDPKVCKSETNRSSTGALCIDTKLGLWAYARSRALPVRPRQRSLNGRNC